MIFNDLEQRLINIEVPEKTETYSPISHLEFMKTIQGEVETKGYEITNKRYWFNNNMNQVIGRYRLNHQDDDMEMSIGFKNSYDKTMSAALAVGSEIILCSNGMLEGEFTMKRKHTGNIHEEIFDFTISSIDKMNERFERLCVLRDKFKEKILHQSVINELIGKLFIEEEILRSEQLNIVKRELLAKEPTYDYGVDRDSMWNMYSICSYAVDKKTSPMLYIDQHGKLLNTFEQYIDDDLIAIP